MSNFHVLFRSVSLGSRRVRGPTPANSPVSRAKARASKAAENAATKSAAAKRAEEDRKAAAALEARREACMIFASEAKVSE